ncbi:MAG: type IV pilus secretin PilQ [Candidatus Krumholzibacteriia bacterium]
MKKLFMIRRSVLVVGLAAVLAAGTTVRGDTSSINSLKVEKSTGSSSFVISKMGAIDVQDFVMEDPPRLVLDFLGAKHDLSGNKFDGDGQFVRRVRSSQFSFEPDEVTRIVFDLEDGVSYEVSNLSQSVTVRFFKKGGAQAVRKPKTMESSVGPAGMVEAAQAIKLVSPPNTIKAADEDATQAAGKPKAPAWSRPATTATPKADGGANNDDKPKGSMVTSWTPPGTTDPAPAKPAAKDDATKSTVAGNTVASPKPANPAQPKPAMPSWMQTPPGTNNATTKTAARPLETSKPAKRIGTPTATTWSKAPDGGRMSSAPANATQGARAFQTGLVRNRNMTVDVQNASIKTVLRSMAEFSGTNIISGPEVEGKVTVHLKNVPWRQALDMILKAHGFGWREEYGIIRVSTMENLTKEELELQAADRKKDELLPLVTRILPLSFAKGSEIKKALKEVKTKRGSIEVEEGNNALIINDIEKAVVKIEEMVKVLDRRTRQVEIVAKLVDVDFEASREMGIRWDALNLSSGKLNALGDAVIDARSTTPVGTFRVGTVQSWGQIQAIVDLLERDNRANIISNPRIVTADNREANILVGKEIPLIVSDEAGNPITELTKVGIILRVTPHVNKDNSITLDLHPEVSELSAQATVQGGVIISLSEADTRLVVANGETAVMGGLINEVESSLENGVPLLKDIPLVGNLFKLNSKTRKKRELIIFVTPRIVDVGVEVGLDSGMGTDGGFDE